MDKFKQSLTFNGQRYVTELPFRPNHDILPDNYQVSYQRLNSLVEKRLKRDVELSSEYDKVFKDYTSKGIIEQVPESEIPKEHSHYLPHHPVVRRDKTTTKMRPVFDGSCSVHKPSLNDTPDRIFSQKSSMFCFGTNFIALIADIQQAFLNIEIAEKDRDFLRFLWKSNPTDADSKTIIYRFLRVVFGLTCSPFLLNATIKHHLETYELVFPEAVNVLKDDFYVDNLATGVDSANNGKELTSWEKN